VATPEIFDVNPFDGRMKLLTVPFRLAITVIALAGTSSAVELDPRALQAWNEYVKAADSEISQRVAAGRPFLRFDDFPTEQKQIQTGEVLVIPRATHGMLDVPRGLIHDWIGSMFIPNVTLDRVLAVAQDYAHYKDLYKPVVASSKVVRCSPAEQELSMVWLHHAFARSVAIESELKSHDYDIGNGKWYNVAWATRLQEIEDFGQRDEHLLPPDQGNGFLWRVHNITKYEQRDGGTYVEFEGMALSRDIPLGIRWLVKPIVEQLARISVATFLRKTRAAVGDSAVAAWPTGSCRTTASFAVPYP